MVIVDLGDKHRYSVSNLNHDTQLLRFSLSWSQQTVTPTNEINHYWPLYTANRALGSVINKYKK